MNVGIVLSGGANNGIYEIGCIKAIAEHFEADEISCISASSIGSLVGASFSSGQLDFMIKTLKQLDSGGSRKFFLSFSRNKELYNKIHDLIKEETPLKTTTYVTVWNFTERKTEYINLNELSVSDSQNYLCAAVTVPAINKGVKIKENIFFDGAIVDNIPVYPLLEKELDIVFCIYFDNHNYCFENEEFNKKVVKLLDFPRVGRFDILVFDPKRIDNMINYGYEYTKKIISQIDFNGTADELYDSIKTVNNISKFNVKYRLTADSSIAALNKVMSRFSKRNII